MDKILTALSGGVDSATACILLRQSGYAPGAATMLLRDGGEQEAAAAQQSAQQLGIAFHLFDWKQEFYDDVVLPFIRVYQQGSTPNPCIFCNRTMKFGRFLDEALRLGYDGMATGHYARIERDKGSGRTLLKTAADRSKDQTYMLSVLNQFQLSHTVLPLGGISKEEARALAEQAGLSVAHKHDSQDICFIPDGDYLAFLKANGVVPQAGRFRDGQGRDLGAHKGLEAYTLGQRRGLELAFGSRMYVVAKRGTDVILGPSQALYTDTVNVENLNWIPFQTLDAPLRAQAKLRYSTRTADCTVEPTQRGCTLHFDEPQRAPTSGQTAALYDGELVLGGGIIV